MAAQAQTAKPNIVFILGDNVGYGVLSSYNGGILKLGIPLVFNLYTNPREDEEKVATETWIIGPVLKMVAEFEASVKKHPLIPMGTPDPYTPPMN